VLLRSAVQLAVSDIYEQERLPAPLWEIFSPARHLDALSLGIRILPLYTNMSYETALDDESHPLKRAIRHDFDDAEIPLSQPERLFSIALDKLPPMERPLAAATRFLESCANNDSARFLCLGKESQCLLRFRHLAHIWIRLSVTTAKTMMVYGRKPHLNRWLSAANGMRPALIDFASIRKDPNLTPSEIASLPDGREDLEPFATWLREDQQVQTQVAEMWNSIVREGKHLTLPSGFSVPRVNGSKLSDDDSWIYLTRHEYGPM
jgi:hypothetical protein